MGCPTFRFVLRKVGLHERQHLGFFDNTMTGKAMASAVPQKPLPKRNDKPLVPIVVVMISIIGMRVTPVPVLRLFALVRLGEFMRIPVVLGEVLIPGAILV